MSSSGDSPGSSGGSSSGGVGRKSVRRSGGGGGSFSGLESKMDFVPGEGAAVAAARPGGARRRFRAKSVDGDIPASVLAQIDAEARALESEARARFGGDSVAESRAAVRKRLSRLRTRLRALHRRRHRTQTAVRAHLLESRALRAADVRAEHAATRQRREERDEWVGAVLREEMGAPLTLPEADLRRFTEEEREARAKRARDLAQARELLERARASVAARGPRLPPAVPPSAMVLVTPADPTLKIAAGTPARKKGNKKKAKKRKTEEGGGGKGGGGKGGKGGGRGGKGEGYAETGTSFLPAVKENGREDGVGGKEVEGEGKKRRKKRRKKKKVKKGGVEGEEMGGEMRGEMGGERGESMGERGVKSWVIASRGEGPMVVGLTSELSQEAFDRDRRFESVSQKRVWKPVRARPRRMRAAEAASLAERLERQRLDALEREIEEASLLVTESPLQSRKKKGLANTQARGIESGGRRRGAPGSPESASVFTLDSQPRERQRSPSPQIPPPSPELRAAEEEEEEDYSEAEQEEEGGEEEEGKEEGKERITVKGVVVDEGRGAGSQAVRLVFSNGPEVLVDPEHAIVNPETPLRLFPRSKVTVHIIEESPPPFTLTLAPYVDALTSRKWVTIRGANNSEAGGSHRIEFQLYFGPAVAATSMSPRKPSPTPPGAPPGRSHSPNAPPPPQRTPEPKAEGGGGEAPVETKKKSSEEEDEYGDDDFE